MKSAKYVLLAAAAFAICLAPAARATTINDPWAPQSADSSELNLYQIYNSIFGTSYTSSADLVQVNPGDVFNVLGGAAAVEAQARYAGYGQEFGFYQPTDSSSPLTYTQLFDIENPNSGTPLVGFSTVISPVGDFGFYDLAGGTYWHSQTALNPGAEDHMVTLATSDPNVFLLAFEDLPFALSDQDYNDLVVQVTVRPKNIVPEPTSMALLGMGLAGMVVRKMRSRKAVA